MSRSVAVLSDVHGVLPALDAVLADPQVRAAERIVVTGDIAAGPQPAAVLDRLLALGARVVLVRGNADRELCGQGEPGDDVTAWAAGELARRPDLVAVLRALPHPVTLDVAGFGPVLFCHGSPRADDDLVLVDSPPERWLAALADVPAEVRTVVCGHTHMPFVRVVDRRTVINAGSVGMPYGPVGASWALLDGGAVTWRRSVFDVEAARAEVAAGSTFPDVDAWTAAYLHAVHSDLDALAAFTPRSP